MAYRIRNYDNMSVQQVNDIFRRGRGLGRRDAGAAPAERANELNCAAGEVSPLIVPTIGVADEELELEQGNV